MGTGIFPYFVVPITFPLFGEVSTKTTSTIKCIAYHNLSMDRKFSQCMYTCMLNRNEDEWLVTVFNKIFKYERVHTHPLNPISRSC